MNGEKIEFFKNLVSLNEIRVAAGNKLDSKRFAPEIIVLRNGKKLDVKYSEGVLQIVALQVEKDIDFWLNTLQAHCKAKDTDGVKRALVEMSQDARNALLLQTVENISLPLSKACVIELLGRYGLDMNAAGEAGVEDSTIASQEGHEVAAFQLVEREEGVLAAEHNVRPGPLFPYSCSHARFADLLLRYGADPLTVDYHGNSCIFTLHPRWDLPKSSNCSSSAEWMCIYEGPTWIHTSLWNTQSIIDEPVSLISSCETLGTSSWYY